MMQEWHFLESGELEKKITSATSEVLNMESSVKILQYLMCNTRYILKKNAEQYSETFS